jgi:phosphate transport system substrate-binding protein
MIFYETPKDKERGKAMVEFMKWALTDGQKYATSLGYAPLPAPVVKQATAALGKIKTS